MDMKLYAQHDAEGRITAMVEFPPNIEAGEGYVTVNNEEVSDETHYVDLSDFSVKQKTLLDAFFVLQGMTVIFSKLPAGCYVHVMGGVLLTDEDGAEIEFDVPGVYTLHIDPPPQYKAEVLEVTVG